MAANDGYLRSAADKGESDPDNDLRLRLQTEKLVTSARASRQVTRIVQRVVRDSRQVTRIVQRDGRDSRQISRSVIITDQDSRQVARIVQRDGRDSRQVTRIIQRAEKDSRQVTRIVQLDNRDSRQITRSVVLIGVDSRQVTRIVQGIDRDSKQISRNVVVTDQDSRQVTRIVQRDGRDSRQVTRSVVLVGVDSRQVTRIVQRIERDSRQVTRSVIVFNRDSRQITRTVQVDNLVSAEDDGSFWYMARTNRKVFRNPRGNQRYYSFYMRKYYTGSFYRNAFSYEWSADGVSWDNTVSEIAFSQGISLPYPEFGGDFAVKVYDTGSLLDVYVTFVDSSDRLRYVKGTIADASSTITWTSVKILVNPINRIFGTDATDSPFSVDICRTYNDELVIVYTEDVTAVDDFRDFKAIGSDGTGSAPNWGTPDTLFTVTGNSLNKDKDDVWYTAESGFSSSFPDRFAALIRKPANSATNYHAYLMVVDWDYGTDSFSGSSNYTLSFGGNSGLAVSLSIDENDLMSVLYREGNTLEFGKFGVAGSTSGGPSTIGNLASAPRGIGLTTDVSTTPNIIYLFYSKSGTTNIFYRTLEATMASSTMSSEKTFTWGFVPYKISVAPQANINQGATITIGLQRNTGEDIWHFELSPLIRHRDLDSDTLIIEAVTEQATSRQVTRIVQRAIRDSRQVTRIVQRRSVDSRQILRSVEIYARASRQVTRIVQRAVRDSRQVSRTVQRDARDSHQISREVIFTDQDSRQITRAVQRAVRDSRQVTRNVIVFDRDSRQITRSVQLDNRDSRQISREVIFTNQSSRQITRIVQAVTRDSRQITRLVQRIERDSRQILRGVEIFGRASRQITRIVEVTARDSVQVTRFVQLENRDSRQVTRSVVRIARDSRQITRTVTVQTFDRDSRQITRVVQIFARDSKQVTRIVQRVIRDNREITRSVQIANRVSVSITRTIQVAIRASTSITRTVQVESPLSHQISRIVQLTVRDSRSISRDVAVRVSVTIAREVLALLHTEKTTKLSDTVILVENEITLTSDTRIVFFLHEWSDLEAKFEKINGIKRIFAKTDAVSSIFKRIVAEEN